MQLFSRWRYIVQSHIFRVVTIFFLFWLGHIEIAQADARKDKIEAAFLYNFLKYISWPASSFSDPDTAVHICIYNNPSLVDALGYVKRQKSTERTLVITALPISVRPEGCHIAFISAQGPFPVYFVEISAPLTGILLVSDIPGFIYRGGMIGIVEEGGYLALEINNTVLMQAGLRASSRLLSIARQVI